MISYRANRHLKSSAESFVKVASNKKTYRYLKFVVLLYVSTCQPQLLREFFSGAKREERSAGIVNPSCFTLLGGLVCDSCCVKQAENSRQHFAVGFTSQIARCQHHASDVFAAVQVSWSNQ
jgi:hypothetical protein